MNEQKWRFATKTLDPEKEVVDVILTTSEDHATLEVQFKDGSSKILEGKKVPAA